MQRQLQIPTTSEADLGDYLKMCACTAVMMQSVLSLVLSTQPSATTQLGMGTLYDLVKFTAPAFIFGILYTSTRVSFPRQLTSYPQHLRQQWSALFVPTIWWTLIYLVIFPQVQQVTTYHSVGSFLWQFINGNAAPHLWYNTMMLQFIILMPFFWWLARWVHQQPRRAWIVTGLTVIGYGAWLWFYAANILHGTHQQSWYLLDRLFISFIIYAIAGVLTWCYQDTLARWLHRGRWLLALAGIAVFGWTFMQLLSHGTPVSFANAPYYQPSMTLYALIVISLIAVIGWHQIRTQSRVLPVVHWLATYAYRAYLANVFWLQVLWRLGGQNLNGHPWLQIIGCYLLTWLLSFGSAYGLHVAWSTCKSWGKRRKQSTTPS